MPFSGRKEGDSHVAETETAEPTAKPMVPFLVLEDEGKKGHLVGSKCKSCGAVYTGDRLACAKCLAVGEFDSIKFSGKGTLHTFSIVYQTAPGIPVPFVAAVVDLDEGTAVRANIEGIEPEPENLVALLGKPVELFTDMVRKDREGNDVVAYKFRPA
jgi:uncharacterized OB-fold protein